MISDQMKALIFFKRKVEDRGRQVKLKSFFVINFADNFELINLKW